MITNKIIREEVDELKILLSQEELNIPSFWNCIWPGLVCMIWFLLSSYLSYGINIHSAGLERMGAMIFAGAMGVFSIIIIANTRSLFLSLPDSFRRKSIFFRFLSNKCKIYGTVILLFFLCFSFCGSYVNLNAIACSIMIFFSIILTIMVMNIDLGRYQLATLTSVIESFKKNKNNLI